VHFVSEDCVERMRMKVGRGKMKKRKEMKMKFEGRDVLDEC
jgi:hypothetical protein